VRNLVCMINLINTHSFHDHPASASKKADDKGTMHLESFRYSSCQSASNFQWDSSKIFEFELAHSQPRVTHHRGFIGRKNLCYGAFQKFVLALGHTDSCIAKVAVTG